DRKLKGLVLQMDIAQNIVMASYEKVSSRFVMDYKKVARISSEYARSLNLNMHGTKQLAGKLSGGNQQKVVLAKWMVLDPDILIFDEPTRGIDIGSKEEIYRLISQLAQSGKSIIFISSEMQEMVGMCDRILVLNKGLLRGELKKNEMTQANIMKLASG
ncbi:MAG: ATP-binding cassette domain-containing protein, partial [Proteobacteria bacterium]|nr:ATP-binding cassette domain-containing protein [Pseudomonadota bacterium]